MVSGVIFVLARFSSAHICQSFCQIFPSFPALEGNFSYNNANRMHVQDQHNLLSDHSAKQGSILVNWAWHGSWF